MFLTALELTQTYYPPARNMNPDDVTLFLQRANSYCRGEIGGTPPSVDDGLKTAVALAFEILSEGQTGQTDEITGNITEVAPPSPFNRSDRNARPLDTVDRMLRPYKLAYEKAADAITENGVTWLGG